MRIAVPLATLLAIGWFVAAESGGSDGGNTRLLRATRNLPAPIREEILRQPNHVVAMVSSLLASGSHSADGRYHLALVDKQSHLPLDYAPSDLIALRDYADRVALNRADLFVRRAILPDLLDMVEVARREGIILDISSAYRSSTYQRGLFERHVRQLGREQAERESARPGHSQHQLGTAIDFGSITPAFAATDAGHWLAAHAWRFGFSLSYPEGLEGVTGYIYEGWHWRHIGREATDMERRFFGGIQHYMLRFLADWQAAETMP